MIRSFKRKSKGKDIMIKVCVIFLGAVFAVLTPLRGAQLTPVADISLQGGQYYLEGSRSSFGGNASVYFAPVLSFEDGSALLPVLSLLYRGTRDLRDLVGGDTLVRQTADYGLNVKYSLDFGGTAWAGRLSYAQSLVNETKDESWGSGLFDYTRMLAGVEAGRRFGPYGAVFSFDYYTVSFDNYASLVSEVDRDEFSHAIDTTTYSEISANAGKNVLDYGAAALTAGLERSFGSTEAELEYRLELRSYRDQALVRRDGSFASGKRSDTVNAFSASVSRIFERLDLGLGGDLVFFSSNQNSYDAGAPKFIKDFYSYTSLGVSPSAALYLGNPQSPSRLGINARLRWRLYSSRPAQDAAARYLDEEIIHSERGLSITYVYPLSDMISLSARAGMMNVSSNMKNEAGYLYNYTTMNYFTGFNWRY